MTPAIAAENVQRLFKKIMETTLQRSQRYVTTTIAETDLISILWKHGGRLVNTSDGLPLVC